MPVVVAEHAVDPEILTACECAVWNREHIAKALGVVGIRHRTIRIDVVSEHDGEVAALLLAIGLHGTCYRHLTGSRNHAAVAWQLVHRRMVELRRWPSLLDPVLALLRHELLFGHDLLVHLLFEMVVVIAAVPEHQ